MAIYARPATCSWFGQSAVKFRHTKSAARAKDSSMIVVLSFRPQNAPFKSISFTRRSPVHPSQSNGLLVKLLPYLSRSISLETSLSYPFDLFLQHSVTLYARRTFIQIHLAVLSFVICGCNTWAFRLDSGTHPPEHTPENE